MQRPTAQLQTPTSNIQPRPSAPWVGGEMGSSRRGHNSVPVAAGGGPAVPVRRRQFLRQVFGGFGLAAGLASPRGFGAERQSEQPYASTMPQTQGKPPQFKTKLK